MKKVQDRIDALRKAMGAKGISAYIIPGSDPTPEGIRGGSGGSPGSGFRGLPDQRATWWSPWTTPGLWTDSRYFIQAEEELSSQRI
jgi:Xaa-Pro aminopeptidase